MEMFCIPLINLFRVRGCRQWAYLNGDSKEALVIIWFCCEFRIPVNLFWLQSNQKIVFACQ